MNYNLDMFPALAGILTAKQKLFYGIDRRQRAIARRLHGLGGVVMRGMEISSRVLEMLANAKIPVDRFRTPATPPPFRVNLPVEVHKLAPDEPISFSRLPLADFARRATTCFLYENARFLQRLAEYSYLAPATEPAGVQWCAAYEQLVMRHFAAFSNEGILSVGLPGNVKLEGIRFAARSLLEHVRGVPATA
jgi:hypothetical protein